MSASDPVEGGVGPLCPSCRKPLRETLRVGSLDATHEDDGSARRVEVTFCGACSTGLSAVPALHPPRQRGISRPRHFGVPDPDDPESLEGRFQLRCRDLISEIEQVGFMPGGWISLIVEHGAAGAARELLSGGNVLPVGAEAERRLETTSEDD
jgi:hypothetical protein